MDDQEDDQTVVRKWWTYIQQNYHSLVEDGNVARFRESINSYNSLMTVMDTARGQEGSSSQNVDADEVDDGAADAGSSEVFDEPGDHCGLLNRMVKLTVFPELKEWLGDKINVNISDEDGVTPLHVAAEYGNYETMQVLLQAKATVKADYKGITPLHILASSAHPNPEIAKLLIGNIIKQNGDLLGFRLINKQIHASDKESTNGNTALHVAAENEHMSIEFVKALESIDPLIKNKNGETAFHMAARSENPDFIVSMLETFTPTTARKKKWRMTNIESEGKPTLLEICATRGNAKAVAMLISYGADISKNVLFALIDESVSDPKKKKIKSLLNVYRTIIDNCILCEWLKATPAERRSYPRKGTERNAYGQKQREIMLRLFSYRNDEDRNVIEHAIEVGAEAFLREIVNTPNVFKITDGQNAVKYDVTDFLVPRGRPQHLLKLCRRLRPRLRPIRVIRVGDCWSESDAEKRSPPEWSYLYQMTDNKHAGDLWKYTGILQVEPFQTITQPICEIVKFCYAIFALLQLLYMVCFSYHFTPSYCSLADRFAYFNVSGDCKSSGVVSPAYHTLIWLPWPIITSIVLLLDIKHTAKQKLCLDYLLSVRFWFLLIMILWIISSFISVVFFLACTSLMHLFGWLFTLYLFICSSETLFAFLYLVKGIILVESVLSSGIAFLFITVSFSSAVHALRNSALNGHDTYFDTLYSLFATAIGSGDFMQVTCTDSLGDVSSFLSHQLRITFAVYLCFAIVIILNILTSTMIYRYDKANQTAKNVWRFHMVKSGLRLISLRRFSLPKTLTAFRHFWRLRKKFQQFFKYFVHTKCQVSVEEKDEFWFLKLQYSKHTMKNLDKIP